jgi:hypothetical protein
MSHLKQAAAASIYFFLCFGLILLLKKLMLSGYNIEFYGLSAALGGALVAGKVCVLLEHSRFGSRFEQGHPRIYNVAYKSVCYGMVVLLLMAVEHGFHQRHEAGSFIAGMMDVLHETKISNFAANWLCVWLAFVGFNLFQAVEHHLGHGAVWDILMHRPESDDATDH